MLGQLGERSFELCAHVLALVHAVVQRGYPPAELVVVNGARLLGGRFELQLWGGNWSSEQKSQE
ncbi:MAG: hypothetical protein HC927_00890 [Deltaproteobacteria bacterium]|nr:hypothetical protein [Deltaproteobacteria bacterium]